MLLKQVCFSKIKRKKKRAVCMIVLAIAWVPSCENKGIFLCS